MSPKLKPLLLPQLVEKRQQGDVKPSLHSPDVMDLSYVYYTTNSSSSDITSPLTPTFSPKGHQRFSSSTSSLDLPPQPPPECPASPSQTSSTLSSLRQLPDVEEEPIDREEDTTTASDHFGLYSCLCDQPCDHRKSSEAIFPGELVADFDFDYDMGFLSDGDFATDTRYHRKRRNGVESTFTELTSRLGSRMPTIKRWRSSRRVNLRTSPTTALSLENVLSRAPSISLTSSRSASNHHLPEPAPVTTMQPNMSYYDISDRSDTGLGIDMFPEDHNPSSLEDLERDRAMATTPLLPPLLIDAMAKPARESPLQSPKISSSPTFDGPLSPGLGSSQFARPPLSSRPSTSSLRNGSSSTELPLPLPAILQEHDEWSDRLGHANFTITPQPYELETFSTEAIAKFRNDWDLARVNYTKHLVRTGENYGQTSKIYALTEAKWAEAESRWMTTFEEIVRNTPLSPSGGSASVSRNQSRGRGRGRSSSSNAAALARLPMQDDIFADLEWRRLDDCLPSAVPQMLESLDADGKFPGRGDEDIVGPMQRDSVMARARSEDPKGRFWKNLADKVGLRK